MNILFISYWAFHEGLTSSTVLPHLKLLSELEGVSQVVFTSIERDLSIKKFDLKIKKVKHIPLYSKGTNNVLLNKWHDFTVFPKQLIQYCEDYQIDKVICRGAPAGAIGYLVWRKTKVPFIVESFEPHAQYMLESGIWKKYDPRYLLEYYWEEKQKKHAEYLIPVAHNYKRKLIKEGVAPSKIEVVPCTVNLNQFDINKSLNHKIREQLTWADSDIVGVYVGKFGGLYYNAEAYECFKKAFIHWGDAFKLIILTPDDSGKIIASCQESGVPIENVVIKKVAHKVIPEYLNTADFAFTFYKPGESKKYLSPIKVGEYWACGLPVVISEDIGDDSEIIKKEEAGLVIDQFLRIDFLNLEKLIAKPKTFYREIAMKYRNPEVDKQVYEKVVLKSVKD